MKKRAVVALLVALAVLALFVLAVGWEDVLSAVEQADARTFAFAFVATLSCLSFRSLVWHRVLSVVDRPRPYWLVSGLFLTATFAKYVTPYGQVTSGVGVAAVVSRYYDSTYEEALAGIVSADFCNYLPYYSVGSVGLGYVLLVHSPPIDLRSYAPAVGALVAAVALFVGILVWRRSLVRRAILRLAAGLRLVVQPVAPGVADRLGRENVAQRFEGFYATLDLVSRDRVAIVMALVYAHLAWLSFAVALYVSAVAVGHPVPFGVAVLTVALSKLGFVVPTPGGLGGVEATIAGVLFLLVPISAAVALAIAILYRFATYWFTILVGGVASIALALSDPRPSQLS